MKDMRSFTLLAEAEDIPVFLEVGLDLGLIAQKPQDHKTVSHLILKQPSMSRYVVIEYSIISMSAA
jgi:hypothetical protein